MITHERSVCPKDGADRDGSFASSPQQTVQYFFFYVLFLTLLAQKTLSVITYSREELLDIRETSTYQHNQHYDQEYDFPKGDPLSVPPRAFELIPEPAPKQRHPRRGCWSGLLVRLWKQREQSMTTVAGVFDNFKGLPLTPPGVEVLDGRQLCPRDVLGRRTHAKSF